MINLAPIFLKFKCIFHFDFLKFYYNINIYIKMKKTIIINSGALDITMIINKSGIFKLKGNRKI